MSTGRFAVRNVDTYDNDPLDDSDDEFDVGSFNTVKRNLPLRPLQSITKPSDFSCAIHIDDNHEETDCTKPSSSHYKMVVTPIIISSNDDYTFPDEEYHYQHLDIPCSPPSLSASIDISQYTISCTSDSTYSSSSMSNTPSDLSRSAPDTPYYSPSISSSNTIHFDTNCGQYLIASNGFDSGCHEWTVKILNTDLLHQEIGVVSNIISSSQNNGSIQDNDNFGARAVYGNNEEMVYYASYNMDNSCRCNKVLPSTVKPWCNGDEVTISLDLEKGSIIFYLNDTKVRKSLSVQRNTMYYPIISNSVHDLYEVVNYEQKTYI